MDVLELGLSSTITLFSGLIGGLFSIWVAKKIMFSRENVMESVDSVLEYALNTVEGQMKVKAVMEKLGEGLIKGTGLAGAMRGGGKSPKLMDILLQLGLQYAQKQGWLNLGQNTPQNQQEQSKPAGQW